MDRVIFGWKQQHWRQNSSKANEQLRGIRLLVNETPATTRTHPHHHYHRTRLYSGLFGSHLNTRSEPSTHLLHDQRQLRHHGEQVSQSQQMNWMIS